MSNGDHSQAAGSLMKMRNESAPQTNFYVAILLTDYRTAPEASSKRTIFDSLATLSSVS